MRMDCIFCKIIAKEIPADIVYEDDATIAFLDRTPVNPGHLLVLPKIHARNVFDVALEQWSAAMEIVRKLSPVVRSITSADGINIHVNNEPAAGQVVFHSHIHVIPRFEKDGFRNWHGKEMTPEESAQLREKIIAAL